MAVIINVTFDPLAELTFGLAANEATWPEINYVSLITMGNLYGDKYANCPLTTTASWSAIGLTTASTWTAIGSTTAATWSRFEHE
jgi:hypothetical protein